MSAIPRPVTGTCPWQQPALIAVEGPIGTGKSSLARRLSELYGANFDQRYRYHPYRAAQHRPLCIQPAQRASAQTDKL